MVIVEEEMYHPKAKSQESHMKTSHTYVSVMMRSLLVSNLQDKVRNQTDECVHDIYPRTKQRDTAV